VHLMVYIISILLRLLIFFNNIVSCIPSLTLNPNHKMESILCPALKGCYCLSLFFFFFLKGACILINQETKVSPPTQSAKYMKDTNTSKIDLNSD
jgi:hypothetical protein